MLTRLNFTDIFLFILKKVFVDIFPRDGCTFRALSCGLKNCVKYTMCQKKLHLSAGVKNYCTQFYTNVLASEALYKIWSRIIPLHEAGIRFRKMIRQIKRNIVTIIRWRISWAHLVIEIIRQNYYKKHVYGKDRPNNHNAVGISPNSFLRVYFISRKDTTAFNNLNYIRRNARANWGDK